MNGSRPINGFRRVALTLTAVLVSGAALTLVGAGPAAADGDCTQGSCTNNGGGHFETIAVSLSGTAPMKGGGGGGGTVQAPVPVECWWYDQTENMSGMSIAELAADSQYEGATRMGANDAIWDNPPAGWWAPYVAREAAGEKLTAYEPTCENGHSSTYGDLRDLTKYGLKSSAFGLVIGAPGSQPDPVVDPDGLIQVAMDQLDLAPPTTDHNPTIAALGGGTLVGLPTYFWVTDPLSVGGDTGHLWIRATAAGVWAQVDLDNSGLTVTSPYSAGASCSRQEALTSYQQGGTSCAVTFTHASTGSAGFPVTAVSTWGAHSTTSARPAPQPIDVAAQVAPEVIVPVGESQAIVQGPPAPPAG